MKNVLYILMFLAMSAVGCRQDLPIDQDLYPQNVYIVGAKDKIIDRDLDMGNETDTISISVAVSGSKLPTQDVMVRLVEDPAAIETYNSRELSSDVAHYKKLDSDLYSFPSDQLTVRAGDVYNTFPIYIKPASLHCDSLYMLAFKLANTSAYKLNQEDTVALLRINLENKYSGLYYMDAFIYNVDNPNDSLVYKMPRNALASDNGHTVRVYHYNNEYHTGDINDYRPTHTFKISVNTDNALTFTTWDKFSLTDGGGEYIPELKLFNLWYIYNENGVTYKVKGFLYKERKTSDEQRLIEDWIEKQRL